MAGPFDKINAALSGNSDNDSNPSGTKIGRSSAEFMRSTVKSMSDHADDMHPVKPRKRAPAVYGADWDK